MTPWTRACQALLSSTASQSWVRFMLVALMTLSNHLVLCRPLLLLPSHFPNFRVFFRESSLLMRWPKYWSLSFRICPSNETVNTLFYHAKKQLSIISIVRFHQKLDIRKKQDSVNLQDESTAASPFGTDHAQLLINSFHYAHVDSFSTTNVNVGTSHLLIYFK